jgi:hypothetical protein
MYRQSFWNTNLIIAKDLVRWAPVEQRQRRAVPADLHRVFDQALDCLLLALLSLKTFAKRINYSLGKRFSGALSERSR